MNQYRWQVEAFNSFKENYFSPTVNFFSCPHTWVRSCKNTFVCLIGCSIGDFGTIIYFQLNHPSVPLLHIIPLAMAMGLLTSIILESIILKIREKFSWQQSVRTAFSMSFLSMLAMETAENATDLLLTGGTVPLSEPFYWIALFISLLMGFLVPLPYNYWKLKKYGKSCH